jgi:hypothetical protein
MPKTSISQELKQYAANSPSIDNKVAAAEEPSTNYIGIGPKVLYSKPTGTMVGIEGSYTFGNELKKKIAASILMSIGTQNSEDMNTTQRLIDDPYYPEGNGYEGTTKGFKVDREKSIAALLGVSLGNDKLMAGVEAGGVLIKDNVNYSETDFFHATEGGASYDNLVVNKNESVSRILPMAGVTVSYNPHKNIGIVGSAGYIFGKSNETSPLGAKLDATNGAYGSIGIEVRF